MAEAPDPSRASRPTVAPPLAAPLPASPTRITPRTPRKRRFGWVLRAALPSSLIAAAGVFALLMMGLEPRARLVFFAFAVATVLFSTTRINSAFVAVSAVVFLVVTGAAPEEALYASLASDVVWLMIGAFIVAAAIRDCGLADRFTRLLLRRAKTVSGAFWLITAALIPLSAFIPSTSGRAAIFLPVFHQTATSIDDKKAARALSLLVPAVVLTSTSSTLIAAGSHLIANEMLAQSGAAAFDYAKWAFYGAPFGIVTSVITCALIQRMLLDPARRKRPFRLPLRSNRRPMSSRERITAAVGTAMIGLWLTQPFHGLRVATVTLAGALVLCTPRVGSISWKKGLTAVSWNLVIFVGAVIVLGRLLLDSGVVHWMLGGFFDASGGGSSSDLLAVTAIALVTLTSHLVMPSHSTRVAVLIPPLLVLVEKLGLDAAAAVFIANMGINYCLTLPIHSKSLLLYRESGTASFATSDLLRVGAVLLPIHFALLVAFYFGFWRPAGLSL